MTLIVAAVCMLLLCFAGVLLFGAPYLPTLRPQVNAALKLAKLKPGQTLIELGCGDGKVLIAAARQGIHSVGYELNPLLYALCIIRSWRHRKYITVIWGDFWKKSWPSADAIFVFLLPKYMKKLDTKIEQYTHKPVVLVSFAFRVPGKMPDNETDGLYRYNYQ